MGEDKDIIKEIISAWGENFENHLDKMVLEGLGGWFTKPIKAKRIPTLTGRINKIKSK
jgi:hypothetical protein